MQTFHLPRKSCTSDHGLDGLLAHSLISELGANVPSSSTGISSGVAWANETAVLRMRTPTTNVAVEEVPTSTGSSNLDLTDWRSRSWIPVERSLRMKCKILVSFGAMIFLIP